MGMFDSFYDQQGNEWQTKAFECDLNQHEIGDKLPTLITDTFQVEVLGGCDGVFEESYATIREGRLAELPAERDDQLPLMDYHGHRTSTDWGTPQTSGF